MIKYTMRDWKQWIYRAGIRAIKTVCQTALSYGFINIGMTAGEIDWKTLASVSLVAGVFSLITSLAGLPELGEGGDSDASDID